MLREVSLWSRPEADLVHWVNSYFRGDQAVEEARLLTPRISVHEEEKQFVVTAELPGVDEKDVQLTADAEGLKLSGEKKTGKTEAIQGVYRQERAFGKFERFIRLPEDVDRDAIAASYKNGVLTITLPRKAAPVEAVKKIAIQSA